MSINIGKFCIFTQGLDDFSSAQLQTPPLPQFGCGSYSFTIEIPNIYVGPHKAGALYSFVSRIVRVHYQPDIVLEEPFDLSTVSPVKPPAPVPVTEPLSVPKTKRRRKNVPPTESQKSN